MQKLESVDIDMLEPSEVPKLVTEIPGPKSRERWPDHLRFSAPGISGAATLSGLVLDRGRGAMVADVDGNVFIDFCSGTMVASTGHRHPKVMSAIKEELDNFLHSYDFVTDARIDFFRVLSQLLPAELSSFQMYTTGSETVEAAMRLAKAYTGRFEFISLFKAFHGKTLGSMSALGGGYKKGFGPSAPGFFQSPNAYCYRCPFGLTYPSCDVLCADFIQQVFDEQTTGQVAAVIVEPIQGAGGVIIPPPEFLAKIRKFCDANGILLIFDEILTGAGRTGKLWAFEHTGIVPDIVTLGKGIGSGYPVGVLAARPEIMKAYPFAQPAGASTTFGGHSVAARAAQASLEVIVGEGLVDNAARVGSAMLHRFNEFKASSRILGDVRGAGLLIGLEFVADRASSERISQPQAEALFLSFLQKGVLTSSPYPLVRIAPPLVIDMEMALRGVDLILEAIAEFEEEMGD